MTRAFKIGYGYDSHRFLNEEEKTLLKKGPVDLETEYHFEGKPLIIGGVLLSEENQKMYGPFKARSDGDVLYHAVTNALLSALSDKKARDIGTLFPNIDKANSNRNSADFLEKSVDLLKASEYEMIDLKLMVKGKPRANWSLMEKNLESFFSFQKIFPDIHIQATSGEEMDGAGQGLGVEVFVICLLQNKKLSF